MLMRSGRPDSRRALAASFGPIVLGRVASDMDVWREESFGPIVSLRIVESEEEAVQLANDTEYGLSSAVFTEDLRTGLRVARRIEAG